MRPPFYSLNERYFRTISLQSQAYILGFIWADGTVNPRTGLRIMIQERDINILEYIRQELKSNAPIKIRTIRGMRYADFSVNRKAMNEDLYALGLASNKSKDNAAIPNIPSNLLPSFIRGLFDGDGSIWKKDKHYACAFNGGNKFLMWLSETLENANIRCNATRFRYGKDRPASCSIEVTNLSNIRRLKEYMEQNTFSLDRKTQKLQDASDCSILWDDTHYATNGIRDKIWSMYKEGLSQKAISDKLLIPYSSVRGSVQRSRKITT